MFLVHRVDIPAKEGSLAASTIIEGVIELSIGSSEREINRVESNSHRRSSNVEQIVLLVKMPPYSQIKQPHEHWQLWPYPHLVNRVYNLHPPKPTHIDIHIQSYIYNVTQLHEHELLGIYHICMHVCKWYQEEEGIYDGHPGDCFMEVFMDEIVNTFGDEISSGIH